MKLTKTLVALMAASALVVLAATPASAVVHTFAVTGGTFTTTLGTYDLGPTGTPGPCTGLSTDTDRFEIDATTTSTGTAVTDVLLTRSVSSGTPSQPYEEIITLYTGNNTGSVTSTGVVTQNVSLRLTVRTGCTSTGTLICMARMEGQLSGNATAHPFTTSTTVHLSGNLSVTGILGQPCNPWYTALIGSVISVSSLTLHVTA